MKKFYFLPVVFILIWFGCKKDKRLDVAPPDLSVGLHIQIVSGNNQSDTVGNALHDSVTVKVTNNGSPVSGYIIQFKRSGCQDQTITEKTTSTTGQASFAWYLSGETGPQSLRAILLDNNRNKKDSTSAAATGIAGTHGWHRGGCLQNFPVNNVTALSSGRILASINAKGYPYYSDDNGISWHPLTTFPKNYFISKMLAISNGIYLATQNDGLFYSGDNGQTWSLISSGIWNMQNFSDMVYTKNGNLIVTNVSGLFVSSDNGQSWAEEDYGLPMGQSTYPCEQLNGDLFVIASDNNVYRLPVHTGTWLNIGPNGNYILSSVESLFIDEKGSMFVGTPHDAPDNTANLYESADGGMSWSQVFTQTRFSSSNSYPNIDNISKINGIYYFTFAGIGVYQTTDFNHYSTTTTQLGNIGLVSYTVAKNSTFVLGSPGYGVYYLVP